MPYVICNDMPQSPGAITHKEFLLERARGPILAGTGQISTSQGCSGPVADSANGLGPRVNRGVLGCSLYAVVLPDGVDILTINNDSNKYNE